MYLPELNWETQVASVIKIDATHYECTVSPTNPNEPGGDTAEIIVGECYLMDYVGHIFEITQVVSGTLTKVIRVLDSFGEDMGPQQGRSAYVYKSVGSGQSPYVSPVNYRRLDASAIDYALPIEKDIIWRHRGLHGVGTGIDEVNLTKLILGDGLKFSDLLSTGWRGGKSVTIGVDDHNNLPGLQGIGPDYYHLMYEQYRGVSAGSGGYLPRYNVAGWLENSKFTDDGTTPKYNANTIWHSGNDGAGSTLDADTIDGIESSGLMVNSWYNGDLDTLITSGNWRLGGSVTNTPNGLVYGQLLVLRGTVTDSTTQIYTDYSTGNMFTRTRLDGGLWKGWHTLWHSGNSNLSTVDWTVKDLFVTTAKIGTLAGYLKGTLGVVGAVSSIPESDITPTAYSTLTITSNATTWDCSTGLNKRVTISANLALTITNLVDGMSGDLVINVSSISTISITTAGFTQKKYGSLTSKPVGKYHLCWICEGTNIDFNITDTPYA